MACLHSCCVLVQPRINNNKVKQNNKRRATRQNLCCKTALSNSDAFELLEIIDNLQPRIVRWSSRIKKWPHGGSSQSIA